jgi:hypothetical protein
MRKSRLGLDTLKLIQAGLQIAGAAWALNIPGTVGTPRAFPFGTTGLPPLDRIPLLSSVGIGESGGFGFLGTAVLLFVPRS